MATGFRSGAGISSSSGGGAVVGGLSSRNVLLSASSAAAAAQAAAHRGVYATLFFIFMVTGMMFWMVDILYLMMYVVDRPLVAEREAQLLRRVQEEIHQHVSFHHTPLPPPQEENGPKQQQQQQQQQQHILPGNDAAGTTSVSLTAGKEPILELLHEAGIEDLDNETLARLPTWEEVAALYGHEPVYYGMDTCMPFQRNGDPAEHFVSCAGTFNTGTNLMSELLINNCHMPARQKKYGSNSRGVRWQVLWGKHTPVDDEQYRQNHRTYNDSDLVADNMFPAVMVRDPYKWMQSMCRHEYGAKWYHNDSHCPNLVPNEADRELFPHLSNLDHVPVDVVYADFTKHHTSLVDFWNTWYADYIGATWPRLMVRFEDVLFHPKEVTQTVCECAGGELDTRHDFRYIVDSAKKGAAHGTGSEKTSYVDALIRYGSERGRYHGYEYADLEYAADHLDSHLMNIFGYKYAPGKALDDAISAES